MSLELFLEGAKIDPAGVVNAVVATDVVVDEELVREKVEVELVETFDVVRSNVRGAVDTPTPGGRNG